MKPEMRRSRGRESDDRCKVPRASKIELVYIVWGLANERHPDLRLRLGLRGTDYAYRVIQQVPDLGWVDLISKQLGKMI